MHDKPKMGDMLRTSWRMVRLTQSDGTTHQVLVPPGFVVWTGGADEE